MYSRTLYCNQDRDQHTILEGNDPEFVYFRIMGFLREFLKKAQELAEMSEKSTKVSKGEKRRQANIVAEFAWHVSSLEGLADVLEYRAREAALVLVWATEVSLATVEYYEDMARAPKGVVASAHNLAGDLLSACKQMKVQPYGTVYRASRVAEYLES